MKLRLIILILLGITLLVGLLIIYTTIDPDASVLFPKCPFLMLTGLECPGCGSQRTIHAMLNGEWLNALKTNLLVVLVFPYLFIAIASLLLKSRFVAAQRIYEALTGTIATYLFALVFILSFILKNVF